MFTNTIHAFLCFGWFMNSAMGPTKKGKRSFSARQKHTTSTVFYLIPYFYVEFLKCTFLKMPKYTNLYIYHIILVPYPWSSSWFLTEIIFFPWALGGGGGGCAFSFFALKDYQRDWFGSAKWSYSCWTKAMKVWKWREHLDKLEDGLLFG